MKGRDAVAIAKDGDAEALGLFERHGRWLGLGIAGVVNAFEPQYVVIGGGLSRAADLFLDAAIEEAARNALPALWERTTVSLAKGGRRRRRDRRRPAGRARAGANRRYCAQGSLS